MDQIGDHLLWIGNAIEVSPIQKLMEHEFEAVVSLAVEEPCHAFPRELISLRIPLYDDGSNNPEQVTLAIDAVTGLLMRQQKTFVFCSAGMSRSPAIVAAALARLTGNPLAETLSFVATHRPCDVSPGLWSQVHRVMPAGLH